jgi:hypothetical protein
MKPRGDHASSPPHKTRPGALRLGQARGACSTKDGPNLALGRAQRMT